MGKTLQQPRRRSGPVVHAMETPIPKEWSPGRTGAYEIALDRAGSRPVTFFEAGVLEKTVKHPLPPFLRTPKKVTQLTHADLAPSGVADGSIDFLLLGKTKDGAPPARDVLEAWWPKLRAGGLMSGDEGGAGATEALLQDLKLPMALRRKPGVWLAYKPVIAWEELPIYCVNLASRHDRRAAVTKEFEKAGIAGRVEFFEAVNGKTMREKRTISSGQAGCVASHLGILAIAEKNQAKHVLVFEDDVQLADDFVAKFRAALTRCPSTYDILYPGVTCTREWGNFMRKMDDESISRAPNVLGSFAYLLRVDLRAEFQRALSPMQQSYDQYMRRVVQVAGDCYVCTPFLASHASGFSDVAGHYEDTSPGRYQHYIWR